LDSKEKAAVLLDYFSAEQQIARAVHRDGGLKWGLRYITLELKGICPAGGIVHEIFSEKKRYPEG
jgi:hypothetical protein